MTLERRLLSLESRVASQGPVIGVISAVNGDGTVSVDTSDGGSLTAWLTDQTEATAAPGRTARLSRSGGSFQVASTMAPAATGANLVPNGAFAQTMMRGFAVQQVGSEPYGWHLQEMQGAQSWTILTSDDNVPPDADQVAEVVIGNLDGATLLYIECLPFTVDPGATYQLSYELQCDATIVNPQSWPSITAYANQDAVDANYGQNVTNGVLSSTPGQSWQRFGTTLATLADTTIADVILGIVCDASSVGTIRWANVSLSRIN